MRAKNIPVEEETDYFLANISKQLEVHGASLLDMELIGEVSRESQDYGAVHRT
jgi:hypothetical protein